MFETSAFAGTALVVTWLVLSERVEWRRVLQAGTVLALLRAAMLVGFATHRAPGFQSVDFSELTIFQYVEDQTLIGTFALCLLLRVFTRLRLTTSTQGELVSLPPRHVTLGQLFVLTALIACVLGARQAAPLIWGEGLDGAIHAIISAHVVAIVVPSLCGLLALLGSVHRWTWVGLAAVMSGLPFAISAYSLSNEALRMENWVHFSTAVAGPAVTTLLAAIACRAAGIRLRQCSPRVRPELPARLPADLS